MLFLASVTGRLIAQMRVEMAVMQERSRMEVLMEEELRIQAAILRNP